MTQLVRPKTTNNRNKEQKYQSLIDRYFKLYGLKSITNKIAVSKELLRYCKQGRTFVVVVLVNTKGQIYLHTALNRSTYWELPGGFVGREDNSLEAAAARIVKKESSLAVDEIRPLAVIENHFTYENDSHIHRGLAYMALVRTHSDQLEGNGYIGEFMNQIPERVIQSDEMITRHAFEYLQKHIFNPPFNEIDESSRLGWRHSVHRLAVQPIQRVLSSRILRRVIVRELEGTSIIDVSCGDDSLIVELANSNPAIDFVANDIVWPLIDKLTSKARCSNIIFTNHDIQQLPYREKFDTVIFKNTLHHFSYSAAQSTIKNLYRMARQRLIVIDVEDPRTTKLSHYLWNRYYVRFLRDQGTDFWSYDNFTQLIDDIGPARVNRIVTQRANYMIAIYDKKS